MSWLSRVANVLRAERITDELEEELQFHVDSRARDLMTHGMTSEEAYREVRRRLGNAGAIRERSRDVKLVTRLDAVVRDLRFAIRMLRRDRVVSMAAIASLALAIGGCTVAFALVDALILRPLPVPEPATLVSVGVLEGGDRERTSFNYPLFMRFVDAVRGRAELAAFSYQSPGLATFDAAGGEERVYEQFVSGNAFGMLGVRPALGRLIVPSDDNLAGGRASSAVSSRWNAPPTRSSASHAKASRASSRESARPCGCRSPPRLSGRYCWIPGGTGSRSWGDSRGAIVPRRSEGPCRPF
jgi:hypothetical protein